MEQGLVAGSDSNSGLFRAFAGKELLTKLLCRLSEMNGSSREHSPGGAKG